MTEFSISIIVRTKDRPEQLAEALRSINDAHIPNPEIVIVNDGETDVQEIVTTVLADEITFHHISPKTAQGRSQAGNLGAEAARSPYIFFLDDDDLIGPKFLSLLNQFETCRRGNRVFYGKVEAFHCNRDGSKGETYRFFGRDFDPVALLWENFIPFNAAIIPRNLFMKVGGLDSRLEVFEDWDLFLKLSEKAEIAYHPVLVGFYRLSKNAFILGGSAELQRECRAKIFEKHWEKYTPRSFAKIYDHVQQELRKELLPEIRCFESERKHWMKMDRERKVFIDDLTNQISLKDDYINELTTEVEKRGHYIPELQMEIEKKENYIHELTMEIQKKGNFISKLNTQLRGKK